MLSSLIVHLTAISSFIFFLVISQIQAFLLLKRSYLNQLLLLLFNFFRLHFQEITYQRGEFAKLQSEFFYFKNENETQIHTLRVSDCSFYSRHVSALFILDDG